MRARATETGWASARRRVVWMVLATSLLGSVAFRDPVLASERPGVDPGAIDRATAEDAATAAEDEPLGLQLVIEERGRVSQSVDAAGTAGPSARLDPVKPAGGTLRRAALFVASTGFTGPAQGSVQLDGVDVPLGSGVPSSISSVNYWADVTDLVRARVNAAPAGPVVFEVAETASSSIDGVIIALVFDDPALTSNRSVSLLFGGMQTAGDEYLLQMSAPLQPDRPSSVLEMSVGVSFGYQSGATGQYSTIDINGRRLTSSAGGEDDGESGNGALITVGGVGDSRSNPADPNALPASPRDDDELYDLTPFVQTGDTSIRIATSNPSADDNLFFAAFVTNPPTRSIATPNTTFKYVALGDSFSAGEGVEPFFEPTNRCHRSQLAYATQVEAPGLLGSSLRDLAEVGLGYEWGFQACSGAETPDMLSSGQWGDPMPQLQSDRSGDTANPYDLPVDEATDLITLTIGGNNVQFSEILKFCALSNDCTTQRFRGSTLTQYARDQRDELSPNLDAVYGRISSQAPYAQVLVLGYPQLFPESAAEQTCAKLSQRSNPRNRQQTLGYTQAEQNLLRRLTSELNQTVAARVRATGVGKFVRTAGLFGGHEICGNEGEWINGPTLSFPHRHQWLRINDQAFHPNQCGHQGFAALVNLRINFHLDDVTCRP